MLEQNSESLDNWKNELKSYEKQKRTKKPFGKQLPLTHHVTHKQVKQKELIFNPVLQTYNDPNNEVKRSEQDEFSRAKSLMNHVKNIKKFERNFDIVNLHSNNEDAIQQYAEPNGRKLGPLRNAYNVINNTKLPDYYFQNREMRLPVEREKVLLQNNQKEYNIITGIFNKNHESRIKQQQQNEKQNTYQKYWKTHEYDPVFGKFYSEDKQKQYQEERKKMEKQHGKDYESRLPPSYHLPENLQTIDEKRFNSKKRYQIKYVIEDEYNKRNVEDEDKHEKIIKNRVHNGRIQEHKAKQFDIITMKVYDPNRAQQLFNKKNTNSTWDRLNNEVGKIKTGGFN